LPPRGSRRDSERVGGTDAPLRPDGARDRMGHPARNGYPKRARRREPNSSGIPSRMQCKSPGCDRVLPQIAPKKRSPMGSAHEKRVGPPHELLRRPAPQRVPGVSRPRNVAPEGPGARSESITPAPKRVSIIPRCGHGVRLTDVPNCPGSGIVLPRGNEGNGVSSLSRSLTSGVFLSTLASAFVSSTTWRSSRIEANWRVGRSSFRRARSPGDLVRRD
jgi:hypothetical protein